MAYANKDLGNLELYCPACAKAKLGTKLDSLYSGLTKDTPEAYSGELLSDSEVNLLNNMCGGAKELELGTLINGILSASKNGEEADEIDDELAEKINKGMCGLFSEASIGNKLQEMVEIINTMVTEPEANMLSYNIGGVDGYFDGNTIYLTVPTGSSKDNLVATFTLSDGATAKVGNVEQVSGTTANDFTSTVTYTITASDGTTTKNYIVAVLEADATLIVDSFVREQDNNYTGSGNANYVDFFNELISSGEDFVLMISTPTAKYFGNGTQTSQNSFDFGISDGDDTYACSYGIDADSGEPFITISYDVAP